MVLSIEERVFVVEYAFREGNRYSDQVHRDFAITLYKFTQYSRLNQVMGRELSQKVYLLLT
jgi:hypothetical protein